MSNKAESEIHCNYTDAEVAKSFIEDVEAVKELLPQAEKHETCKGCLEPCIMCEPDMRACKYKAVNE